MSLINNRMGLQSFWKMSSSSWVKTISLWTLYMTFSCFWKTLRVSVCFLHLARYILYFAYSKIQFNSLVNLCSSCKPNKKYSWLMLHWMLNAFNQATTLLINCCVLLHFQNKCKMDSFLVWQKVHRASLFIFIWYNSFFVTNMLWLILIWNHCSAG